LRRLQQLLADRKISLRVTEVAKAYLADQGYDPVYGARPLKRAIQRLLQDPLALALLRGDYREGDTVVADYAAGEIVFSKAVEGEVVAEEPMVA
jgi:ATP-dependent Clp protease ATP-binding subunit ClpB